MSSVTDSSTSWCSQPNASATRRASPSSFVSSSRKPIEKVTTGRLELLRHQRDDQARVHAAREHGPERHVAHEAVLNGRAEELEQLVRVLVDRSGLRVGRGLGERPVRLLSDPAVAEVEERARCKLADAAKECSRARHVPEREVEVDRLEVELDVDEPAREDRLELRGEDDEIARACPVERLDPEPVTCQDGPPAALVPDRDAELPAEALREACAVPLVEVRQDLRVAAARERVPLALELAPQLLVVVQLAVLDGDDRAVLVQDGLVATRDVHDREPSHAEGDPGGHEGSAVVGTTVRHDVGHDV